MVNYGGIERCSSREFMQGNGERRIGYQQRIAEARGHRVKTSAEVCIQAATEEARRLFSDGQWHSSRELIALARRHGTYRNAVADRLMLAEDQVGKLMYFALPDERTPDEVPAELHMRESARTYSRENQ